jgi:hypothetical protein
VPRGTIDCTVAAMCGGRIPRLHFGRPERTRLDSPISHSDAGANRRTSVAEVLRECATDCRTFGVAADSRFRWPDRLRRDLVQRNGYQLVYGPPQIRIHFTQSRLRPIIPGEWSRVTPALTSVAGKNVQVSDCHKVIPNNGLYLTAE